jgi:hypothetical protein
MKNYFALLILALTFLFASCNNRVQVTPKDLVIADSAININFKAYPDNDYYRSNLSGIYTADIELYLRAFQALNPKTPVQLTFHSDKFGILIIKKDTLYPDDQTSLVYSDFNNFRQNAKFYSNIIGTQKLDFDLKISTTVKKASTSFENR